MTYAWCASLLHLMKLQGIQSCIPVFFHQLCCAEHTIYFGGERAIVGISLKELGCQMSKCFKFCSGIEI